ncbi:flavoprotein [Actinoplanes sp. NEAU-A12]|uniref:Flavoprotein n=1 Tax=Actinoplanes sandaracinus TaxID=3045177 RepID=A0ABT6WHF4_9ACTN|nr:flavoprotein [Actinoplanes sandaracinus]MDI6099142.1 flavoprotein [Actinoplanes sandaracinus]
MAAQHATSDELAALLKPQIGFRRLLLVGTGALTVTHLPFWVNWIKECYPDVEVRVMLTPSATRFVTVDALTALTGRPVTVDSWTRLPSWPAPHLELADWPDAILVHPAGLHFLARLALGLADTPLQLALQLTPAVIGIAPALPPGHAHGPAAAAHLKTLAGDHRIVVGPTEPAVSATTGEEHDGGVTPVPTMLRLMQQRAEARHDAGR